MKSSVRVRRRCVGLLLGFFAAVLLVQSWSVSAAAATHEIVIGALIDQTGTRRFNDARKQAALTLGEQDINAFLSQIDAPFRIKVVFADTRSDPQQALEKMTDLALDGVRVFIGPSTSAEVERVKSFADQRRLLVISPDSTAASLTVARDSVYRFAMDDTHQAEALAHFMWDEGIRVVVPFARKDIYGDDFLWHLRTHFQSLGGKLLGDPEERDFFQDFFEDFWPDDNPPLPGQPDDDEIDDRYLHAEVRYHPDASHFIGDLERLAAVVNKQIWEYGADVVAVQAVAFGEIASIMEAAERWPVLSSVRWFGTDGTALNEAILLNGRTAEFAAKTRFVAAQLGKVAHATDEFNALARRVRQLADVELTTTSAAAYDALWVSALAHVLVGPSPEPAQLYHAFEQTARWHFGVSGWTALNEAGDRKLGSYDFWAVERRGRSYEWNVIGEYQFIPGMPPRLVRH